MAIMKVAAVEEFGALLNEMLAAAVAAKQTDTIEPPLLKSDLADLLPQLQSISGFPGSQESKKSVQYAVIETAVRDVFNQLLSSSNIEHPAFAQLWNLFDVISILSDEEQCEPALLFWLVEELLDSQMISGCRKIFDYLESRRDRITKNHFKQKNLVILRSCNELLRRLSRAEDTAFCGRVFIFMFQSFPLGDKSSVNLRGEYHVENITAFDQLPTKADNSEDRMEVDTDANASHSGPPADDQSLPNSSSDLSKLAEDVKVVPKSVSFTGKSMPNPESEKPLDPDTLYPIFWSLQQSFSQPKKLFDAAQFAEFKKGLEAAMAMFRSVQNDQSGRGPAKFIEESKKGTKRKRGQGDDDLANAFNPKYLTSRDLFELELSDLSFRRHICVQSLIIMDFILSLGAKAKEKVATLPTQNKSVMYQDQILGDEDAKWATEMKKSIAEYLKQGFEGPFFYRMVETVLSRDKNWVRWKVENCPSIEQPSISAEEYVAAKSAAIAAAKKKNLRKTPLGSLDLKFLEADGGMEKLKQPKRYRIPTLDSFKNKIALDDMEIEMPTSDETKEAAIYAKSSKSWRALRIASKCKLASFDKIDDPEKIDIVFQEDPVEFEATDENNEESTEAEDAIFPSDRRLIVISGPSGVGKGTIVEMMIDKHPQVFGKKVSHTTRVPREGEVNAVHYYFINSEQYNVMRDGDQFLEVNNFSGNNYATSRKVVEGIIGSGKVPIMELDYHGIQQLKEQNYPARYIFLAPPSLEELERRLRARGTDSDEEIKRRFEIAKQEIEHSQIEGFYDIIIVNDDLGQTFEAIENFVHRSTTDGEVAIPPDADTSKDLPMESVPVGLDTNGVDSTADAVDIPMHDGVSG